MKERSNKSWVNTLTDRLIITTSADPFTRGLDYLYGVRGLALEPEIVNVVYEQDHRVSICTWIGEHIADVNLQLEAYLQACCDCFYLQEQPATQIFAAPLAQTFGVDGICNFQTHPVTLLIDVGRVYPQDWLLLVAHEYAHAHAGSPGHHSQFARSLSHLCLGLGILPPPPQVDLRFYPPCPSTADPLAFWCGVYI